MTTIEIDGIEYIELETVNKEIAKQLDVDSAELSKELDISTLQERHARIQDELQTKQAKHEQIQRDEALTDHVKKYYSNDLKDVSSFIELCKTRGAYNDDSINETFKLIPRKAKKNIVQKFLQI